MQNLVTDETPMPFGKWKGTPMKNVPSEYLDWLVGQSWMPGKYSQIVDYVERSRKAIDQDLNRKELI
jgi:uncharacterized protein (DUF3820 family)